MWLLFEKDWEEVLCCSHCRLIRVRYQHILIHLIEEKEKEKERTWAVTEIMHTFLWIVHWSICIVVCLSGHYLLAFFKCVFVIGEMDHTLDQLQHQSCHHLDIQWLSIVIWAIQPLNPQRQINVERINVENKELLFGKTLLRYDASSSPYMLFHETKSFSLSSPGSSL